MKITIPTQNQALIKGEAIDPNWYVAWSQCANWINENSQSGTTAQRPTTNLYNGRHFTDTSLNIYLTYSNGAWRNGAGVAV